MALGNDLATSAAKEFVFGRLRGTYSDGLADDALAAELLAGPTGGRIHSYPIPDDIALPVVAMMRYGSRDDPSPLGRNVPSVATTVRLQVKAICEGYSESPIESAASIVNQLLDGRSAIVDVSRPDGGSYGTYSVEATRESDLLTDLPPETDGTPYQQLGGVYNFFVVRVG